MEDKTETMITIPEKEYDALQEESCWLSALEAAGVDNWSGYDQAKDILEEWGEEDNDKNKEE
jgi:hypothetical protein